MKNTRKRTWIAVGLVIAAAAGIVFYAGAARMAERVNRAFSSASPGINVENVTNYREARLRAVDREGLLHPFRPDLKARYDKGLATVDIEKR